MTNGSIEKTGSPRFFAGAMRSPLVRLLMLGLVLGFAFQGTRGLWSPDEGRYVVGALQMLDSGDFLTPAYSPDRVNFSKPPLTYWTLAAAVKTMGRTTWAVRTPYALAFVLTIWLLYGMGKRLVPAKPWLPGLIYAGSLFPFLTTNIISTDVILTLAEAIAMLGFVRAAFPLDGGSAQRRDIWLMWFGFGLAFLTKGPPGLIPLLAILPFILRRDGWRGVGRLFSLTGLAIFALVGLLWYLIAMLRYPWLAHYFMHREVYERLFTNAQRRHAGAWGWLVVYLPTLAVGFLPWWPGLGSLLLRRNKEHPARGLWLKSKAPEHFLMLWFVVPLIVFCLAQSRLPLYLLPLFLPLSLILAIVLQKKINLHASWQLAGIGIWLFVLLAVKGGVGLFAHPRADDRLAAQRLTTTTQQLSYSAIVFVQDTKLDYDIEQKTTWGLRFYMNKPIYGIAWNRPDHQTVLCHLAHKQPATLLVLDPAVGADTISQSLASCPVRSISEAGTWHGKKLTFIEN
jgi:4-amino-4-deoxy-L-arabinose transferase-like glycosyltransferase